MCLKNSLCLFDFYAIFKCSYHGNTRVESCLECISHLAWKTELLKLECAYKSLGIFKYRASLVGVGLQCCSNNFPDDLFVASLGITLRIALHCVPRQVLLILLITSLKCSSVSCIFCKLILRLDWVSGQLFWWEFFVGSAVYFLVYLVRKPSCLVVPVLVIIGIKGGQPDPSS